MINIHPILSYEKPLRGMVMAADNVLANQNLPEDEQAVLQKALLRVTARLMISRKSLGQIIGISEASISRLYDGSRLVDPHSKEGELALLLLRAYRSLDTLLGGNKAACQQWFHSYNEHLQAKPDALVVNVSGLMQVVNYLDAMRGKV